jgi:tight adherence protein C
MTEQVIFIGSVFGAIVAGVFFLSRLLMGGGNERLRERLTQQQQVSPGRSSPGVVVVPLLQRLGQAAAQPFMPKKRETQSRLRRNLARAGIYTPSAVRVVTGFKLIMLCAGLAGGYLVGITLDSLLLALPMGGLIGYMAPQVWMKLYIERNQKALTLALPDALDLMVVCVEAGLTIDAAMQRVGEELGLAHPALSRELGMVHMETRVGLARSEAMRNLAQRTGNAAVQSLVAMLVQADRFGTSIAHALRVHADSLRAARQAAAEELAAKASVKISFPLVLCIFPATFIVLIGPTAIQLFRSEFMQ